MKRTITYQSDNNSSADDADWADLRGFAFACGESFLATNDTNFHEPGTNFVCAKAPYMNEVNV